jgi:hypothetical protein
MMRDKAIALKNGGGSDSRSLGLKPFGMACLSLFSLALIGLIGSATVYAGTIDMSGLLTNANFSSGNVAPLPGDGVGCPIGWTCSTSGISPGGTSYQPNDPPPANPVVSGPACPGCSAGADITTQYVAGSDGLSSLGSTFITPNGGLGTWAAQVPDHEGNGTITQTGLGTYDGTDSYAVNLWVGTPLTIFDLLQGSPLTNPGAGPSGQITAEFLGNSGALLASISITPEATPGMWYNDPLTFTPTGAEIGQSIGFQIVVGQGENNEVADFVIEPVTTTSSTPEPGTFALLGIALISLAYFFRRKLA